jgi:hypothetical protein
MSTKPLPLIPSLQASLKIAQKNFDLLLCKLKTCESDDQIVQRVNLIGYHLFEAEVILGAVRHEVESKKKGKK